MSRTRSPIRWFGGKSRMATKLLKLMPPHKIYVEVFGGGASLLFAKEPSPVEVYNDLDSGLVNFFRVLRDPTMSARLHMLTSSTPCSREEYQHCLETWAECDDQVERAYRWFVVARMSFSGIFGNSFGLSVTSSSRGMAQSASSWLSSHDLIGRAYSRLLRVQIEHLDFGKIFEIYDTPQTLFYIDPPYITSTRKSGGYKHELSDDDHRRLVNQMMELQGKAMLSGYGHEIYKPLKESGWRQVNFETTCSAAARTRSSGLIGEGKVLEKQKRIESVWISPNARASQSKRSVKAKLPHRIHSYTPHQLCA